MDVGVRALRQNLSAYLDRAAAGEEIRVTDRGVPKAMLSPLPAVDRVDQGIAEGWITAPSPRLFGSFRPLRSARTIADVLDEDRAN